MIKQQQPQQLKAQTITYAIYAYNSKTAEQTQRLKYGDLEIVLKNDHFEFVCKGGAVISNIKEILFMNSKIKGITDDITSIPPEEQRYYALNAFPKVLKIGRFNLNEEFIEGFLNDIMKKADKEYVDSELMKKANLVYVNDELNKKADKEYVASKLEKKADKEYVDEKDNEIKEMVEWYHERTSKILKTKADTGWVSGCLDLKADKEYVNDELNKKADKEYVASKLEKKADKEYVDSELMKKANLVYVNDELNKKADKEYVASKLEKKADKEYVDEKDNEIKEMVEWYHERTSKILKTKADTGWVSGCLDLKADKEYVNDELNKKADKEYVASKLEKKADKEYVDEKDNEIKEMVEWYHERTSKILKTKADTGWVSGCLDLKADKEYVNDELNKKADKEYVASKLEKKADISFVNEEIKQSEVYFTPPFLNFMKSSDKTFDIDSFEWICFDGVTMYLFYTAGVLYYFKTNDFKNYESFTPSVLNPDTREPIINPIILYVEYNNGKFMGMITVGDDFYPCYSFDCIQWFKCNLNQDAKFKYPNNPIRCVNNKWVLIYEVNQIFISEDGINYYMFSMMSSDLKIDYTSKWYYINNMYFILQNDKIYRSSSISQGQFERIFQADGDIEALCYGSNVYVLVSSRMVYSYPVSY
ncbi:hypothetical protein TVAGG3_0080190, partial [Trichomonas vaginalis G3]|uniref:hypothetical protein n=1 Tax=Trichomonas vaginalis (strain ATCC PRA-98 / G3) TaxID=412133 RepID=UPI0021E533A0